MTGKDHSGRETALIGCLLLEPGRLEATAVQVSIDCFEDPACRAVYGVLLALKERGAPIGLATVLEELRATRRLELVGGLPFLVEVQRAQTCSSFAPHLAGLVVEDADRRRAVEALGKAKEELEGSGAGRGRVYELADKLREELPVPRDGSSLGIQTIRLSDIEPKPVTWLWPGRIPLGKLTLLAGDPGLGKSTVSLDISARATSGQPWPDSPGERAPVRVLLASAEDGLADTIRPRLDAAGGDPALVDVVHLVRTARGDRDFSLEEHLPQLRRRLASGGYGVLVVDPVSAYMGATDTHKNSDVRRVLGPLAKLAEECGVAVLAISHLNKTQGGSALYRTLGSIGFAAAVRAMWFVVKDKDDPERRLLVEGKNNLGAATGLAYRVRSVPGPEGTTIGAIEWEKEPVTITADEALSPPEEGGKGEQERACDFIRGELEHGPVEAQQVLRGARENGIAERTLTRGKKKLGVQTRKVGVGWQWYLPEDGQGGHRPRLGHLGGLGDLPRGEGDPE